MITRKAFQVGQVDLVLQARFADQTNDHVIGAQPVEGQQALVDVTDLLHVQRAKRQLAGLLLDGDPLDRGQHVQHRLVVDPNIGQPGLRGRVEDGPVVGVQPQPRVLDPGVHGAEQREQPIPAGVR